MTDDTSILQMARGAIQERADYEMAKIMTNITDPNTKATGKRTLTIKLTFVPDEDRQTVAVTVQATSALQPTIPVRTALFIAEVSRNDVTAVEMQPNIPGQLNMDGDEEGTAPVLHIIKSA